jgi:cation diffusion facilitator CzcD-associated flavoprotein CzcO
MTQLPPLSAVLKVIIALLYSYSLWIVTVATGLTANIVYYLYATIYQWLRNPLRQLKLLAHDPEYDPVTWPPLDTKSKGTITNPHCMIVSGAGFSGLGLAMRLKQEGMEDFVVFERDGHMGGTWYANSYPNCACDVPSNLYSFSWEPNPNWTHFYSRQKEIWDYIQHCVNKYEIRKLIRLNTRVDSAIWEEDYKLWCITTSQGTYYCKFYVNANGPLSDPRVPDFPGKEKFQGKIFHSAQWEHDYDLIGKKVVVIGTGASAIQFVPGIVDKVKHMTVFQRTAPYVVPRNDYSVPSWAKKLFHYIPFLQLLQRACLYWFREGQILGMLYRSPTHRVFQFLARAYIHMQVTDPKLRKIVTPSYDFGCKRKCT